MLSTCKAALSQVQWGAKKHRTLLPERIKLPHSHFTGLVDKSLGLAKKFFWVYKTIRKNWNDLFGQPNT